MSVTVKIIVTFAALFLLGEVLQTEQKQKLFLQQLLYTFLNNSLT